MPTGGVEGNKENISKWFSAGVSVVGLGSNLISKDLMAAKDYGSIQSLTTEALQIVQNVKMSILEAV